MELRDNSERARIILNIFYFLAFLIVAMFISNLLQHNLLKAEFIDDDVASNNDLRQQGIAVLYLITIIAAAVYFIRWFRRAYFNLQEVGASLEYEDSMASYGWMIPFINLWRPFTMMKEIWTKTQEHASYEKIESTGIVGIWWTFWIIRNIMDRIETKMPMETLEEIQASTSFAMANNVVDLITLMLVIIIVRRVSEFEYNLYNVKNEIRIEDHLIDGISKL